MKTSHSPESISLFIKDKENAQIDSIEKLTEGHMSQAYSFERKDGAKFVFRISDHKSGFIADKYASDHFGDELLVPKVLEINKYDDESFYCVSEFVEGIQSNVISDEDFYHVLPSAHDLLGKIFSFDISSTSGYGKINPETGNGEYLSNRSYIGDKILEKGKEHYLECAKEIGIDSKIIDKLYQQFEINLIYASETRRLVHGDVGFDNMLVKDNKVTASIDWDHVHYGDWMEDFAALDFWWSDRYGDAKEFASKYGLDTENLNERKALYTATTALGVIEWNSEMKNDHIINWLKEYLPSRVYF